MKMGKSSKIDQIDAVNHARRVGFARLAAAAVAAAAFAGAVAFSSPARAVDAPVVSAAASQLVKPLFVDASKGKILLVVGADFPEIAIKFFSSAMAKSGWRTEVLSSSDLASKKASFYVDGSLMEIKIGKDPLTTQINFSDMGGAAAALRFYIQQNKVQISGPVASL